MRCYLGFVIALGWLSKQVQLMVFVSPQWIDNVLHVQGKESLLYEEPFQFVSFCIFLFICQSDVFYIHSRSPEWTWIKNKEKKKHTGQPIIAMTVALLSHWKPNVSEEWSNIWSGAIDFSVDALADESAPGYTTVMYSTEIKLCYHS